MVRSSFGEGSGSEGDRRSGGDQWTIRSSILRIAEQALGQARSTEHRTEEPPRPSLDHLVPAIRTSPLLAEALTDPLTGSAHGWDSAPVKRDEGIPRTLFRLSLNEMTLRVTHRHEDGPLLISGES